MNRQHSPWLDEADIGSGEKTPGERETEELIRQIAPLESEDDPAQENLLDDAVRKIEHDASLDKDEPDALLDQIDPVAPKGS